MPRWRHSRMGLLSMSRSGILLVLGTGTSLTGSFGIRLICAAPPFFSCLPSRSRAKKPQTVGLLVASITRISTMAYTSIR